jgi:hypothetical protein
MLLRDLTLLVLIVLDIAGWLLPARTSFAAEAPSPEGRRPPGKKDPPEVRALVRKRCELARKLMDPHAEWRILGLHLFADARLLLDAELEEANNSDERSKAYQRYAETLRSFEERKKVHQKSGRGPIDDLWRATAMRLEAEVWLWRAKREPTAKEDKEVDEMLGEPRQIRSLVDQRCELARKVMEIHAMRYRVGAEQFEDRWADARLLLDAELEAAGKPDDRSKAYQRYADYMKEYEQIVRARVGVGRADEFNFLEVRAKRLEAQIWLQRARIPQGEADSPEVRIMLREKLEVIRKALGPAKGGRPSSGMMHLHRAMLEAELTSSSKPTDHLAAYQRYVESLKPIEEHTKVQREVGRSLGDEYRLRDMAMRLEAEIWLLRARARIAASGK